MFFKHNIVLYQIGAGWWWGTLSSCECAVAIIIVDVCICWHSKTLLFNGCSFGSLCEYRIRFNYCTHIIAPHFQVVWWHKKMTVRRGGSGPGQANVSHSLVTMTWFSFSFPTCSSNPLCSVLHHQSLLVCCLWHIFSLIVCLNSTYSCTNHAHNNIIQIYSTLFHSIALQLLRWQLINTVWMVHTIFVYQLQQNTIHCVFMLYATVS